MEGHMSIEMKKINLSDPGLDIEGAVKAACNAAHNGNLVSTFTVAHILYLIFEIKAPAAAPTKAGT
jgi:hypothetical protein